ncbi:hypothetical protein [Treponema phagedenis]|uniref:Uncharacterized protein n=1 Tax=Treponema phagedenis TaxID=162 RepID=A0A0B7GVJ0_TREPH|nr:hypothetical protein [Treponema phagedenis]CEM60980.1 hypothetical protein TPHV1_130018 [Treponema phagedenis]
MERTDFDKNFEAIFENKMMFSIIEKKIKSSVFFILSHVLVKTQ